MFFTEQHELIRKLARDFEVMIEEEGLALRGSFVINPEGEIKAYEIHYNGIGRNSEEWRITKKGSSSSVCCRTWRSSLAS